MSPAFFQTDVLSCSASFAPWAGELLAKITVLLLTVILVTALVGRSRPALRHLIAGLGLLCLLILPVASLVSVDAVWPATPVLVAGASAADVGASEAAAETGWGWLRVAVTMWAVVGVLLLTRLVVDMAALVWQVRVSTRPLADWQARVRELAVRVGIRRRVRVFQSAVCDIPYTWGLGRPAIVLPRGAAVWGARRLEAVLLHELGHIRRRDGLFAVLARVVCALLWFHPLVWWVAQRAREDAERACDALVIEEGVAPARYARYLLEIVRDARVGAGSLAPTMAAGSLLSRRIGALIGRRPCASRVGRSAAVAVLITLLLPTLVLATATLPGTGLAASSGEASACVDTVANTEIETDPVSGSPVSVEPAVEGFTRIDLF